MMNINIPLLAVSKEVLTIGIVIGAIFLILILLLIFKYGWLYIQALSSGAANKSSQSRWPRPKAAVKAA